MMFKKFLFPTLFTSFAQKLPDDVFVFKRQEMVKGLFLLGVRDKRVLEALETVPRHEFVPKEIQAYAYDNFPLPIGFSQTISQPFVVGHMAELASIYENESVLEVGSGCGYNAAVLSRLAKQVVSTEIIPELHEQAKAHIGRIGYKNIELIQSDGGFGYPEKAPYDVIMVTASAPYVPQTLKQQLTVNGRMIIPLKNYLGDFDDLTKVRRISEHEYTQETLGAVKFVPLTGESADRANHWDH